jgi:hypothetical protein
VQNQRSEKAQRYPANGGEAPGARSTVGLHGSDSIFPLAFHLVMDKVGADLKNDLIGRLKEQGLQFDSTDNPRMTLQELETGLNKLLGVGSDLIIKYIEAEIQRLS